MSKVSFSPVEEAVLSLIGSRRCTVLELKEALYPEIAPESVVSAVGYLRRRHLVSQSGEGLSQTTLGVQVLAEYRRWREAYGQGRHLHAV